MLQGGMITRLPLRRNEEQQDETERSLLRKWSKIVTETYNNRPMRFSVQRFGRAGSGTQLALRKEQTPPRSVHSNAVQIPDMEIQNSNRAIGEKNEGNTRWKNLLIQPSERPRHPRRTQDICHRVLHGYSRTHCTHSNRSGPNLWDRQ